MQLPYSSPTKQTQRGKSFKFSLVKTRAEFPSYLLPILTHTTRLKLSERSKGRYGQWIEPCMFPLGSQHCFPTLLHFVFIAQQRFSCSFNFLFPCCKAQFISLKDGHASGEQNIFGRGFVDSNYLKIQSSHFFD